MSKWIKGIEYENAAEAERNYLSEYTYVITFDRVITIDKDTGEILKEEQREKDYITITSVTPMEEDEVIEEAWEYLYNDSGEADERYSGGGEIIPDSIGIDIAYYL